jgi:hypothetical protein
MSETERAGTSVPDNSESSFIITKKAKFTLLGLFDTSEK